ncbi:MAG: TIGR02391 family protein [Candidatus Nomurabacteria bacterium]|jgi:uncharacterized protein (TIGR02391 family)|nr:TIGR02391 family protein [Candidatus Nomurabacteria bacterium]
MPSEEHVLKMSFTPNTIEHLGVRLYSTIPPVIAELIANSYDADATRATVILDDSDENNKKIIVKDDGHGMSFSDINSKFLRIGRNRRTELDSGVSPSGRPVIGKKGLGKLSFFGIADIIEVETVHDGKKTTFMLDWNIIINDRGDTADYTPTLIGQPDTDTSSSNGTTITLKSIKRVSSFDAESLANSLAKMFIVIDGFDILVQHNSDDVIQVTNDRRYSAIDTEIEWQIPTDLVNNLDYENKDRVTGRLFAAEKPIPPATNMRGITLFSRNKLVNTPEYFSDSTSSHFYSYLTGYLEIDFIDEMQDDVIGTDRKSIDWSNPELAKLREYLQKIIREAEKDWRRKRIRKQKQKITEVTGVDINAWEDTIPDDIKSKLRPFLRRVQDDAELPEKQGQIEKEVKGLFEIIGEYPRLHWRELHPELQSTVKPYYIAQNYYTAVFEGVKKYLTSLKLKTGSDQEEWNLLENIWSIDNPKLSVIDGFTRTDGLAWKPLTIKDIKSGHRMLVLAMWQAFRCLIDHEDIEQLRDTGLFTEQDCLDALGLLSHLYYRLENSVAVTP